MSGALWRKFAAGAVLFLCAACSRTKSKPPFEYMPDMADQPSVKAQGYDPRAPFYRGMRTPVPGTVPVDFEPYHFATVDTVGPASLINPLPRTLAVLETGRKYYDNFCIVCHGPKGDGQGYIVPKFPSPPSLLTPRVREFPDGRIYHIITRGRGNMPSYATQLDPTDRWAIIHYVRVLERAAAPTPEDLAEMRQKGFDFSEDEPDTTSAGYWPKK